MPKFEKRSFDRLRFNPLIEGKIIDAYPDLMDVVEEKWLEDPNLDKILRYIIMVYDPGSPVYQSENEINQRRSTAAALVGFEMDGESAKKFLLEMYLHKYIFILRTVHKDEMPSEEFFQYQPKLITGFLKRFCKSKEYAAIMAIEFAYWEMIMKMMDPIQGKNNADELAAVQKKNLIRDEIPNSLQCIKNFYRDFFAGDDELVEEVFEKRPVYSPEAYALAAKNKK